MMRSSTKTASKRSVRNSATGGRSRGASRKKTQSSKFRFKTMAHKVESQNFWMNQWNRAARYVRHNKKKDDKALGYEIGQQCSIRPPCRIIFTRLSSGRLDDDNLSGGFKYIRDSFCAGLLRLPIEKAGLADGRKGLSFEYRQRKCPRGTFGFIVEVEQT